MKTLISIGIAFSLVVAPLMELFSQERFVDPPSKYITSFPFRLLTGGVILIKAKVNEYADSLNFVLDTGSGGISLDSITVKEFNIPVVESDKTIKGIGGIRKVSFLYNASLKLPGLQVNDLNFHVNDYSLLTSVYGIKIDGIIGYSFLIRYVVNINYDSLKIKIFSRGEHLYPKGGQILNPMFTALPMQYITFVDNGKFAQRFYLDTGAGLNFLLSERYVRDSSVLRKKRKPPFTTQAEGVGGKTTMQVTTIREIRVGPYRFRRVPIFVFKDEYNVTNYPHLGGLLGNDLMRRFNVTLNYAEQEVHIIPNSHYRDDFDYAYHGLSMYYIDGKIIIDDVVPGSPADKAGFKKDDLVIAVNNDVSGNIQAYKTLLQEIGVKINFVILREGKAIALSMKPISIL
jgi:hypothetical protein